MRTTGFSDSGGGVCLPPPDADPLDAEPPLPRGCKQKPVEADPYPCGQTNTCENITLPQTSFTGGNNELIHVQHPDYRLFLFTKPVSSWV